MMSARLLRRAVLLIWPNLPLCIVGCLGFAVEFFALRYQTPNKPQLIAEYPVLSTIVLAGFWVGITWIAHLFLLCIGPFLNSPSKWTARFFFTAAAAAFFAWLATTSASWIYYYRTGHFFDIETCEFVWNNFSGLLDYFREAHRSDSIRAAFVFALLALAAGVFVWRWKRATYAPTQPEVKSKLRPLILFLLFGVTVFSGWRISKFAQFLQQSSAAPVLSQLHPVLAFTGSAVEFLKRERIEPVLDVKQLTPLRPDEPCLGAKDRIKRKSIIYLAIEAMRSDIVDLKVNGMEVMPNVNAIARQSVVFPKAYTHSTHSNYADVCVVSSLLPLRSIRQINYTPKDPWPKTLIYDLLKPAGYSTANITSQNESWGGMYYFLNSPNLDLYYDPERSNAPTYVVEEDEAMKNATDSGELKAGSFFDEYTVDVATKWIRKQTNEGKPFFLSMNLQASHFPYPLPDGALQPFQPCKMNQSATFAGMADDQVPIARNAYYNALHYIDLQVGKLVKSLQELNLYDDVVLVVYGENGESFNEGGGALHASDPVEAAIHVACMIHAPKLLAPRVEDYSVGLIDVTPTVLSLLDWPTHPNFQGIDLFAKDRPAKEDRLIFFHVNTPYSQCDAVLSAGKYKLVKFQKTGRAILSDVEKDPIGLRDLSTEMPKLANQLSEVLADWRRRQLAFYQFPFYYQSYYPPTQPKL